MQKIHSLTIRWPQSPSAVAAAAPPPPTTRHQQTKVYPCELRGHLRGTPWCATERMNSGPRETGPVGVAQLGRRIISWLSGGSHHPLFCAHQSTLFYHPTPYFQFQEEPRRYNSQICTIRVFLFSFFFFLFLMDTRRIEFWITYHSMKYYQS